MSHKAHTWLLWASVTGAALAIVISMVATVIYSRHLSADRRAEQVAGCERANTQRATVNQIILQLELELAVPLIPIPNCEEIIK